jgi:hypothetical protein
MAINRPEDALIEPAALKAGVWVGEEAEPVVGTEIGCTLLFMVEEAAIVAMGVLLLPAGRVLLGTIEREPLGFPEGVAEPAGTVLLVASEDGTTGLEVVSVVGADPAGVRVMITELVDRVGVTVMVEMVL